MLIPERYREFFEAYLKRVPRPPGRSGRWHVLMALGISAGVGISFGLYPAWRAAEMDPVEALRHE